MLEGLVLETLIFSSSHFSFIHSFHFVFHVSLVASLSSLLLSSNAEESQHVTGLCEHVFHYNCLMAWMTKGHDNCPTCRQPLWDTPTFLSLLSNSTSTTHEDTEGGMASSLSSTHHHHPHSVFHQSRIQQQQRIFLDRDRLQQQRRRQEQAGFPWARCCQVFNLICFLAGVGYILGSLLGPSLSSSS